MSNVAQSELKSEFVARFFCRYVIPSVFTSPQIPTSSQTTRPCSATIVHDGRTAIGGNKQRDERQASVPFLGRIVPAALLESRIDSCLCVTQCAKLDPASGPAGSPGCQRRYILNNSTLCQTLAHILYLTQPPLAV